MPFLVLKSLPNRVIPGRFCWVFAPKTCCSSLGTMQVPHRSWWMATESRKDWWLHLSFSSVFCGWPVCLGCAVFCTWFAICFVGLLLSFQIFCIPSYRNSMHDWDMCSFWGHFVFWFFSGCGLSPKSTPTWAYISCIAFNVPNDWLWPIVCSLKLQPTRPA